MSHHKKCCTGCRSALWPSTWYLTTNGITVTMTDLGGLWSGIGEFDIGSWNMFCAPRATLHIKFEALCNGDGTLLLRFTYYTRNPCGTPCYIDSTTAPVGATPNTTYGIISSFVNSPLSFSGAWDTSTCVCGSMTPTTSPNPLSGLSVVGSA